MNTTKKVERVSELRVESLDTLNSNLSQLSTHSDLTESLDRLKRIEAFADLVQHGCNPRAAARQVGPSYSSIYRWMKMLEEKLIDWSDPTQRDAVLGELRKKTENCGQKSRSKPEAT